MREALLNIRRLFSAEQKTRIEAAIAKAELNTSGEIVPMVVAAAYPYPHVTLAAAILGEFLVLAVGAWIFPQVTSVRVAALILAGLVLGGAAGLWVAPLRRFLIGGKLAEAEVYRRALQAFHESGLDKTRDRTGILILVSLLERRVHVLADVGIAEKLPQSAWDDVVALVLDGIKHRHLTDGLCDAIQRCGEHLAEHFPRRPDDTNELPDRLLVN